MTRIFGRTATPRAAGIGDGDHVAIRGADSEDKADGAVWLKVVSAGAVVSLVVAVGGVFFSGFSLWKSQVAQTVPAIQSAPLPNFAETPDADLGRIVPAAGGGSVSEARD